jgi:predicted branched-subunit amino acid permease
MTATTVATRSSPRQVVETHSEMRQGVVAMLPLLAGLAPIGLLVGSTVAAHADTATALAGTWMIYGASAHLAFMQLTGDGASAALVVVTCVLINARLVVYSASMSSHWRAESNVFKAVMAATIVDPSFALGDSRYRREGSELAKRTYYIGAAATLWIGWTLIVGAGMALGTRFGRLPVLELALPLCLFVTIAPALVKRPACVAVVTAATVAVAGAGLPSGTGLLASILAGAAAGSIAEGASR